MDSTNLQKYWGIEVVDLLKQKMEINSKNG